MGTISCPAAVPAGLLNALPMSTPVQVHFYDGISAYSAGTFGDAAHNLSQAFVMLLSGGNGFHCRMSGVLAGLAHARQGNRCLAREALQLVSYSYAADGGKECVSYLGQSALVHALGEMLFMDPSSGEIPLCDTTQKILDELHAVREVKIGDDPRPHVLRWLSDAMQPQLAHMVRKGGEAAIELAAEFGQVLGSVTFANPQRKLEYFGRLDDLGYYGVHEDFHYPWGQRGLSFIYSERVRGRPGATLKIRDKGK